MPPGVVLQGVPGTVATPVPSPPPILVEMPEEEEYPDTDGKPMAENTWQATTMRYAGDALEIHFQGRAFVATDLLIYYRKGDKGATVAPDVMVVLEVDGSHRRSYKLWEEGRVPDFVLEVLSSSTQENDEGEKRKTYAQLGVREYFRYAPVSRRMAGMGGRRLAGEVLREGRWEALPRLGEERLRSEVLGLELRVRERRTEGDFRELRFRDPDTGEDLPTHAEERQGRIRAERAHEESERARENERQGRTRAEHARREAERGRREERQGRIQAEREIARLRAMLEQPPGAAARDAPSDGT